MREVGRYLDELIKISVGIQTTCGSKKLKDFTDGLTKSTEITALAKEVEAFAS